MGISNADLVRKAAGAIGTGDFTASIGTLAAEQANSFLDQVYLATPVSGLQRGERRRHGPDQFFRRSFAGRGQRAQDHRRHGFECRFRCQSDPEGDH